MMNEPSASLPQQPTMRGLQLAWRDAPLSASDPLLAWQGLLAARGLHEHDAFFSPRLADLPDPDGMTDMVVAAERLCQAIIEGEHIHIFGDFDADGVCGTAVLVEALRAAGGHVTASIPHRSDDGHGIGIEPMEAAVADACTLGISVDTGTVCFDACSAAKRLGLDLIITDHHLPAATLPEAFALLNPARQDCGFAERQLCGTGVAFFLLMALWKRLKAQQREPNYDLRRLLDRVAVATVADVMNLQGVNRILVYFGLQRLQHEPCAGMAALLNLARLGDRNINVEHIGFHLAPRINAAGRMQHGDDALTLLLSDDASDANERAAALDLCNQERRKVEANVFKAAELAVAESPVLAAHHPDWHAGVVGLVAGRLARKHGRPSAIGFVDPDGQIRVSLRGVLGYHIGDILQQCASHLHHFGGHAGAGGGSIRDGAWAGFVAAFGHAIEAQNRQEQLPQQTIDGALTLSALHYGLADRLQRFEPIGRGNPACCWFLPDVTVVQRRELKGGVVRLRLLQGNHQIDAIVFGAGRFGSEPAEGKTVGVIGTLQKDDWRGGQAIQFVVEDMIL